jgi:hypothetical protein
MNRPVLFQDKCTRIVNSTFFNCTQAWTAQIVIVGIMLGCLFAHAPRSSTLGLSRDFRQRARGAGNVATAACRGINVGRADGERKKKRRAGRSAAAHARVGR